MDFNEFLILMKKQMKNMDPEDELRELFQVFDMNSDGKIRYFKSLSQIMHIDRQSWTCHVSCVIVWMKKGISLLFFQCYGSPNYHVKTRRNN